MLLSQRMKRFKPSALIIVLILLVIVSDILCMLIRQSYNDKEYGVMTIFIFIFIGVVLCSFKLAIIVSNQI